MLLTAVDTDAGGPRRWVRALVMDCSYALGDHYAGEAGTIRPEVIAFVGKAAYTGTFGGRVEHGLQERRLGGTALFVLPSTSPANAAVGWDERLRWFRALRELVSAQDRTSRADSGRANEQRT